ncbi:conserved hypothetical protein [Alteromonas sp. 38]|uniref:DUF4062 domain-containing protein n=1 Tax=unclassified Alteromonas TaxID=2614992 RepID=UPI0012F0F1B1|nr:MULTISPECIES: DUF4062 domain-containing protein [unclassified Alteromonas]CAD5254097.1 conserved hypothetical protein [Alteromonas sp. 154]VXB05893.1 conserved hypothetical protein [Alteromonas sp. 38]
MKINMHTSHPSAFISSTFIDLYEDRNEVASILKKRGLNVNALDTRPASTQSSKNEILNGIKESDFVILLIGDRYGSILKSMTSSDSKSITWWEYINALKMGKPVIAYFKNFDASNPTSHDDRSDAMYNKKRNLFDIFKKLITQRHNPAFYTEPYELAKKLDNSLISIYRAGVKELSSSKLELSSKITQLQNELNQLKSKTTIQAAKTTQNPVGLSGIADLMGVSPQPKPTLGLIDILNKK